eukprot:scaffold18865_cov65-Isochrysis_galbana.AAC.2
MAEVHSPRGRVRACPVAQGLCQAIGAQGQHRADRHRRTSASSLLASAVSAADRTHAHRSRCCVCSCWSAPSSTSSSASMDMASESKSAVFWATDESMSEREAVPPAV